MKTTIALLFGCILSSSPTNPTSPAVPTPVPADNANFPRAKNTSFPPYPVPCCGRDYA